MDDEEMPSGSAGQSEYVRIPAQDYLSPDELIALRHLDTKPALTGQKRSMPTGSKEEADELEALYEQLTRQLSVPNIERRDGRALAEWDVEKQAMRVVRKSGKFGNYGYTCDGQLYLEYYEAMFLFELGRLQMQYHTMIMSAEQAYILLLGEEASPKYNEYLTYSILTRAGYILVRPYRQQMERRQKQKPLLEDCVWQFVQSTLNDTPLPENIINSPHYKCVKEGMENIKKHIMEQEQGCDFKPESTDNDADMPSIDFSKKYESSVAKRKRPESDSTADTPKKKMKNPWSTYVPATIMHEPNGSFLNMLKSEPEYDQFREIFAGFDLIKLDSETMSMDMNDPPNSRDIHINFDLHLHNEGFRKSAPKQPTFRVVILDKDDWFPTHVDVLQFQRTQQIQVPLLIITINESKQMIAFLYYVA